MPKEKNLNPSSDKFLNIKQRISKLKENFSKRKIIIFGLLILMAGAFLIRGNIFKKNTVEGNSQKVSKFVTIDKTYDFPALTNQGKVSANKIKFKVGNAEKTNQVLVKDQLYTAKNNKTFLIFSIELKNSASAPLNIVPGDLIRISYNDDEENKYAPDLHNNMVTVSAISTKLDRIGFVVPDNAMNYKLYVGELEGKKETIDINIPS